MFDQYHMREIYFPNPVPTVRCNIFLDLAVFVMVCDFGLVTVSCFIL